MDTTDTTGLSLLDAFTREHAAKWASGYFNSAADGDLFVLWLSRQSLVDLKYILNNGYLSCAARFEHELWDTGERRRY